MKQKIQRTNPFNRPPRLQPTYKELEVDIPAPPAQVDETARNVLITLLPMTSILFMGVFYAFLYSSGGRSGSILFALPMIGMGVISVITSLVIYGEQKHNQKVSRIKQMRSYHQLLDRKEARLLSSKLVQLDILEEQYPCAHDVCRRVFDLDIRLWERRPEDSDFLTVRIGTGDVPATVQIKPPDPDNSELEIRRAFGIYRNYKDVQNAPVTVNLHNVDSLAIVGSRNVTLPYIRGLVSQIAGMASPEDVSIFLFSSIQNYKQWEWLRWLPQTSQKPGNRSHSMAFSRNDNKYLFSLLSGFLSNRSPINDNLPQETVDQESTGFFLNIFDSDLDVRTEPGFSLLVNQGSQLNAASVFLCKTLEDVPSDCKAVIQINDTEHLEYWQVGPNGKKHFAIPEFLSLVKADNFAHQLLTVATTSQGFANRIPRSVNLLQTYELNYLKEFRILDRWMRLPPENGLLPFPVLIGNESQMNPLSLHLAEQHDGPHGLVAGTTGSGKSELLQTLIAALALEHHPYYVSFLLIDFKGGSAFGIFKDLPHTVGIVSNLDKTTASRALEAIKAELYRRQEFLSNLNNQYKDIGDYHRELVRLGAIPDNWDPLPHLFIIVDEFAQLAKEMPSFLPELIATLRLGRSLGMHLILATQRPAGAINDEMRSNLNFRISLRVQTIEDSRDVLNKPDAALLPKDLPGRAYFQVGDAGVARQFQASYIGGEYSEVSSNDPVIFYQIQYEKLLNIGQAGQEPDDENQRIKPPPLVKQLVDEIQKTYIQVKKASSLKPLPQILLPPLDEHISLRELVAECPDYTKWWSRKSNDISNDLSVLIGRIDNLTNTTQPPLILEFPGKRGGHLIVLGAPGSGKTSFLRTFASSLAYCYSPSQVQIYGLSFAGRGLDGLKRLAHVGDVVLGNEPERVARLLRLLQSIIEERKTLMGGLQVDNLTSYNRHPRVKEEDKLPAIFVLIDNFGELRDQAYLDELDQIQKLIENGRNYGIYFVITALQLAGIPYKTLNIIDQRIALNLTDKSDYLLFVGRLNSLEFDILPPGRGFIYGASPMSIQLADVGDISDDADYVGELGHNESIFKEIVNNGEQWRGKKPVPIGTLPEWINLSTLFVSQKSKGCVVGLDSDTLDNFKIEWTPGTHLLIGGPPQSGRTSVLHAIALSIINEYSPDQAWLVLVDGAQGSLRTLYDFPHTINWVIDEDSLREPIACLEAELFYRRQEVSAGRKKVFPKIFVLIDDYDLTRDAIAIRQEILVLLSQFMRRDSDLGLHFILSGISQKLAHENDPVVKQMKLMRSGFSLVDVETMEALGGRPNASMRRQELPIGRGYFLKAGKLINIVQIGYPDQSIYDHIRKKYASVQKVTWPHPAPAERIEQVKIQQESPMVIDSDESFFDMSNQDLVETYRKLRLREQSGK